VYFRFPLSLRIVEEMLAASRARLRRLPWHYRLGKPFGVERLEAAATRALEIGARTYGPVKIHPREQSRSSGRVSAHRGRRDDLSCQRDILCGMLR
jgi:hypothetical protein